MTATVLRAGVGVSTTPAQSQPEQLLRLYEFEGCPHCRLVREVLTELDLDALILPCPKGGDRYRPQAIELGGKAQFPFLVDPNTGVQMYESADIIRYLFETYAKRKPPLHWQLVELQRVGSTFAVLPRMGRGMRVKPSRDPGEPLELFSFEASPFARPVRELLCEMQIHYVLRSVGRARMADWVPPALRSADNPADHAPVTRNRQRLAEQMAVISIPYLIDPNSGAAMAESSDIMRYLRENYGA